MSFTKLEAKSFANQFDRTSFHMFTEKEVRQISVKQVTNSASFDKTFKPLRNGLHDPIFGATKVGETCETCLLSSFACPGHFGHIELCTHLFNPLLFDLTFQLLRGSCLHCHKLFLQSNPFQLRILEATIGAIRDGDLCLAAEIEKTGMLTFVETILNKENSTNNNSQSILVTNVEAKIADLRTKAFVTRARDLEPGSTRNSMSMRRQFLTNFCNHYLFKRAQRCPSCSAQQAGLQVEKKRVILMTIKGKKQSKTSKEGELLPLVSENDPDSGVQLETLTVSGKRLVQPSEVRAHLRKVWQNGGCKILPIIFPLFNRRAEEGFVPTDVLFIRSLLVMPPKYRPILEMTGRKFENPTTTAFKFLFEASLSMEKLVQSKGDGEKMETQELVKRGKKKNLRMGTYEEDCFRSMSDLQSRLNMLFDSDTVNRFGQPVSSGMKQILEKKEGLFRNNMMGKRVNYAARTVIVPDPYMDVDCVGVPEVFAKKLTFPEHVFPANATELGRAVINGPDKLIGANIIDNGDGSKVLLSVQNLSERIGTAKRLLQKSNKFGFQSSKSVQVYRHMKEGDVVLINRQPTLHKPSIMAHKVKILKNQKTLRLNYANCKTFNADFDGDEMNVHFPQDHVARAEGLEIACTARQYLVPKDGKPISGLIQDHVVSGYLLTLRDTFLSKEDYQHLLFNAFGNKLDRIKLLPPTLLKPLRLWTGKQVISSLLINIVPDNCPLLSFENEAKTSGRNWPGASQQSFKMSENNVIIRKGQLLCGVMDKAQFGASAYGMVHCVYELYGPTVACRLMSCFSRLFTVFMALHGFTLGIEDITLTKTVEKKRKKIIKKVDSCGVSAAREKFNLIDADLNTVHEHFEQLYRDEGKTEQLAELLHSVRQKTNALNDEANKNAFPLGVEKKFLKNSLSLMIQSGAKGTGVNQFQMSCMLGQVDLEGGVIPSGFVGFSLPSFRRFSMSPRCRGFVSQRFLTGLKPQEFFFHCLAGREGLIDTAVKTSRSGYLQRCIIKHLEGVVANYDLTVRDSDGSIVQFIYGEDGMDVAKAQFFGKHGLNILKENTNVLEKSLSEKLPNINRTRAPRAFRKIKECEACEKRKNRLSPLSALPESIGSGNYADLKNYWFQMPAEERASCKAVISAKALPDPLMSNLNPFLMLGALSEKCLFNIDDAEKEQKKSMSSPFCNLMLKKGMLSLVDPGEAVGLLAAQSIGEPSTQMTLNTFHFAGRGEMNVTLGIPRLREIMMTGSEKIKTPTMEIFFLDHVSKEVAEDTCRKISRIYLSQIIDHVSINEYVTTVGLKYREYDILLKFNRRKRRPYATKHLTCEYIISLVEKTFFKNVCIEIKKVCDTVAKSRKSQVQKVDNEENEEDDTANETYDEANEVINTIGQKENESSDEDEVDGDQDATSSRLKQRKNDESEYLGEDEEIIEVESENINDQQVDNFTQENEAAMPSADSELIDKTRVKTVTNSDIWISNYEYDHKRSRWCKATIKVPLCHGSVDVMYIVKMLSEKFTVQSVNNISRCMLSEQNGKRKIITEGVNLKVFVNRPDIFDVNTLRSNDLHTMRKTYGIEATVQAFIKEAKSVFGCYGIDVDHRHLSLLADYMTHTGTYQSFNRTYMSSSTSPLQKMTFETTLYYMKDAIINDYEDPLKNPSSDLVVGKLPRIGTGFFDLIFKFGQNFR